MQSQPVESTFPDVSSSSSLQEDDRSRVSDESFRDLEVGDVPLLPIRGMEAELSEKFARDPSFSCSPSGFCAWIRGPKPPHVYHIKPWFPHLQAAPERLIDQKFPRRSSKIALLFGALIFWIIVFFGSLKASVAGQEVPGLGKPIMLPCHHRLWCVLRL